MLLRLKNFLQLYYEKLLKVMLTGSFIGIKNVFPIMKAQKSGRIINMASINRLIGFAGKAGLQQCETWCYRFNKSGSIRMCKRRRYSKCFMPRLCGYSTCTWSNFRLSKSKKCKFEKSALEDVILGMVSQKRLLSVSEIANYAIFLASENGAGITGQAVVLDGGYTAQ